MRGQDFASSAGVSPGPGTAPPESEAVAELCRRARLAARRLAPLGRAAKDAALASVARRLRLEGSPGSPVLEANAADIAAGRAAGLADAMVDRLMLDASRLEAMADAVDRIAELDDPVGEISALRRRPNGLLIGRQRIPLGVIAMIYESRPNVTVDAAALCLKSGNAVVLRGGKEARRSNEALGRLVREALGASEVPVDAVQIVPPLGREETKALIGLTGLIDLVIPRGGEGLIRFVVEHARVPVIQHYKGVCHLYVDEDADLDMALRLVENGKLSRPGVCNALECLLVHRASAAALLPCVGALASKGLELRGDEATCALVPTARAAGASDWGEEFLAPILAAKVVGSIQDAMDHIARYGSGHTEAICTRSYDRAQRFLREVDASCVLVNASTRFNDGGELGLGAEIGISTTKLHAYGPMGFESLMSQKWIVQGDGQTR